MFKQYCSGLFGFIQWDGRMCMAFAETLNGLWVYGCKRILRYFAGVYLAYNGEKMGFNCLWIMMCLILGIDWHMCFRMHPSHDLLFSACAWPKLFTQFLGSKVALINNVGNTIRKNPRWFIVALPPHYFEIHVTCFFLAGGCTSACLTH